MWLFAIKITLRGNPFAVAPLRWRSYCKLWRFLKTA
jgi:hypothetical protein